MGLEALRELLDAEGSSFYRATFRWQPKDLIPDPYRRNLLKDAEERFHRLELVEEELQTLTKAPFYVGALRDMRFAIRRALYAWRSDDLAFIEAIAEFFTAYGTVLQLLQRDSQLGHLEDKTLEGV